MRKSLSDFLVQIPGYELAGQYSNCDQVSDIIKNKMPDVVIMDINMPGVDGYEGLRIIKEIKPEIQIVMHTVFEDDELLFKCLCAGANGYILKNTSFDQLHDAIENTLQGGATLSPSIARKVLESFRSPGSVNQKYHLSEREKEVLRYLVRGYGYKMIAAACHISIDTVRGHIRNIYAKLHVNCGREAVAIALKDKIVE